jgi:hypothetical protein
MVTVAGYEFCGYWLRTLIVEQINEEDRLSHVSTSETNSRTVICDTLKVLSFLITYSEEVCRVSEVSFKISVLRTTTCQGGWERQHVGQLTFPSLWFLVHSILSGSKLYLGHSSVVNSEASVAGEGQRQVHVTCMSLRILFKIQNSKIFWELVSDSRLLTIASSPIHFRTAT